MKQRTINFIFNEFISDIQAACYRINDGTYICKSPQYYKELIFSCKDFIKCFEHKEMALLESTLNDLIKLMKDKGVM